MINNGFENNCIIDFSSGFSNQLVLKQNKETGATTLYKDAKILFARPKEQFSYEVEGKIKRQWLTKDICSLTYMDKNNNLREFVATYGDRGDGISYYYVTAALRGDWQVFTQNGNSTKLLADTKGITINKNGESEFFEYSDCKQFGTIALVLYNKEIPRYVIALNEDCEIDSNTNIIKKEGTITVCEVSIEKTISESLYCMTYKSSTDMSNYKLVDMDANSYSIKNGILYISYDGENIIEVPGDFSKVKSDYNNYNYQISKEKTIFFYISNQKRYLVYSNDMGNNWETVEISNESTIQNIHFVNSNDGFMLEFMDAAMGVAFGRISKTADGGKTWLNVNYGIGQENEKVFAKLSQIRFFDKNLGFLTMPRTSGEDSELYITKDGGVTFSKINILEDNIYDYYDLPTQENDILYLKVSQGSDGDYNGGDYKTYYSNDKGDTWHLKE